MSAPVYRTAAFLFSVVCYGVFLLVLLYLLAFLCNLQIASLVSLSIDLGRDMGSPLAAVLVDVGLILLFGLQHSVMARPGFKRAWTRAVPKELERSVYVLIASAILALLMWQSRPIPTPVVLHASATWSVALGWSIMGRGRAPSPSRCRRRR
jgi:protein-S-isoprenylcysteine O-methyltransferase Ste14